jgi:hypothetical protein
MGEFSTNNRVPIMSYNSYMTPLLSRDNLGVVGIMVLGKLFILKFRRQNHLYHHSRQFRGDQT